MKSELFLDSIAAKLGRAKGSPPSARTASDARRTSATETDAKSLTERFQVELERVGGIAVRCASSSDVEERLLALIAETKAESLVSWSRTELESWSLDRLWRTNLCRCWEGGGEHERAQFRECAATARIGITTADLAIASTGSLVLRAGSLRPRSVSLLPSMHVALLDSRRIVARMGDAYEKLATRESLPSQLLFITGPSRTSDIENDLTIGVHGPASVVVLIAPVLDT